MLEGYELVGGGDVEYFRQNYDWDACMSEAIHGEYVWERDGDYHPEWDEVERVVASEEGEHDAESWVAVLAYKDGRYAYLEGWCDYTGWD